MRKAKQARTETVRGVTIVSRHGFKRELIRMRKSVASLPEYLRSEIVEFFCDSKVGNHYVIEVRSPDAADALIPFLPPLRGSVVFTRGGETVGEVGTS